MKETSVVKQWLLAQESITELDFAWFTALGVEVEINRERQLLNLSSSASSFAYQGCQGIYLTTTTDQQQATLILKYGEKLVLLREIFKGINVWGVDEKLE